MKRTREITAATLLIAGTGLTILWVGGGAVAMGQLPATVPNSAGRAEGMKDELPGARAPAGMMNKGGQIYLDDSFGAVEKIQAAARYVSQRQDRLAIEMYQDVLENCGQKLLYLNDNSYVSV